MFVLGDDNIMLCNSKIDVSKHGTETKTLFNITSKISQRQYVGQFLSMLVYNTDGEVRLCPDFIRMRHRFSVCNYAFEEKERENKVKNRVLSYCLMLGGLQATSDWALKHFGVITERWFDWPSAIVANSLLYETDEAQVWLNVSELQAMMLRCETYEYLNKYFSDNNNTKQKTLSNVE